jgi:alpha-mannosidase
MPAPGAQVQGPITAGFVLATDAEAVRDAELGLRAVLGGAAPLLEAGTSLLALEPRALVLSACTPAAEGDGLLVRVLNPTDEDHEAVVRLGVPVAGARAVRLDESPSDEPLAVDGDVLRFPVRPHGLRTVLVDVVR